MFFFLARIGRELAIVFLSFFGLRRSFRLKMASKPLTFHLYFLCFAILLFSVFFVFFFGPDRS